VIARGGRWPFQINCRDKTSAPNWSANVSAPTGWHLPKYVCNWLALVFNTTAGLDDAGSPAISQVAAI
jgi:hypothetical protein